MGGGFLVSIAAPRLAIQKGSNLFAPDVTPRRFKLNLADPDCETVPHGEARGDLKQKGTNESLLEEISQNFLQFSLCQALCRRFVGLLC